MAPFTGSGVAIITPFTSDGINFDAFGKLIEFQLENDTDAIIVCGTTGEPATMTEDEKHDVISFCVKTVAGRVPVIAGTGSNCTKKAIADSLRAQELGVDGLLVITPYYNKCTQDGLIAHFTAVADAVKLPIIIYNVPARTGVNALPDTLKKLSAHERIVAVKEASANIEQITELARVAPDLVLYSGNDDHVLPLLALGAHGVISVTANVCPRAMHDLVFEYFHGDIARSRRIQFAINPITKALFSEVNPIPVKTACGLMGFDVGPLRLPLTPMSQANKAVLIERMKELNLISIDRR